MGKKQVLAVDLGASSGRVMLASCEENGNRGARITVKEVHRFPNDPVTLNGTLYWDFLRLFYEIKQGLLKARSYGGIDGISVDTWGVDFGLLDARGELLANPVHYRDRRTEGMRGEAAKRIDQRGWYKITGSQFMEINTAYQLLSLVKNHPETLEGAESLLMMPDLFHYFLSGSRASEYSIASTTQLLDARKRDWSQEVVRSLGLPGRLLQPVVPSGSLLGSLAPELKEELMLPDIRVIAGAGHDTQCALVAAPAKERDFIFLSCGTWSLFGTELDEPITNDAGFYCDMTNEGGFGRKISFLKNITGLWLMQESRRQWQREGKQYSYGELEHLAEQEEPFLCLIDVDAPQFAEPGDMPKRIRECALETGQRVPETPGQIARCINESLALKYRRAYDQLTYCTGKTYQRIYMIGGGIQSRLLCRMTAAACALPVSAGPVEATVYGNAAIQLHALGALGSLDEMRRVILSSVEVKQYEPEDLITWQEAYGRYCELYPDRFRQ